MNTFFITLFIGISLSMDAFSLSLIYGLEMADQSKRLLLSTIVGLYHLIMPLIGYFVGSIIFDYINFKIDYITSFLLFIIGIDMILSSLKDKDILFLENIFSFMIFGLSVSIDSFTVGVGLNTINSNYLEVSFMFMLCSFIFTYIGLFFGNKLNRRFGNISTIIGGLLLILMSVYYVL